MVNLPWWIHSPSPFTFFFWFLLALYGIKRLKPKTRRDWITTFCISAFIVGLVVLPFDLLWTVHQAFTFGHLHPQDLAELLPLFNLKLMIWVLCLYESRKLFKGKSYLEPLNLVFLSLYYPLLMVWFRLAPDPSWTDWTYAWRFGFGSQRILEAFFISHVIAKLVQAIIYIGLWKKKT